MHFNVIDVETANPDCSSICQVGVASFEDCSFVGSWSSLVNPDDYFDSVNISIHGINEEMVRNAPKWPTVYEQLLQICNSAVVVSHTHFDRIAVIQACERSEIEPAEWLWLDSASVVRRTWPEFIRSGYGLANVAGHLGIVFRHHDAEEDARAAGEIMLRAIAKSGASIDEWLKKVKRRITPEFRSIESISDGALTGERIVFTGALSMPRREAAELAANAGCAVDAGVTKHTTLLVVGDQDILQLAGQEKSGKHRKAEGLIQSGQPIRIIGESDFRRLLAIE